MNATSLTASPAWVAAGWTMLHLTWVGAAVGLVAAAARRAMKRARPEARYAAALALFAALALAPAAIFSAVHEPGPAPVTDRPGLAGAGGATAAEPVGPDSWRRPRGRATWYVRSIEMPPRPWLDSVVTALPWLWLAGSSATLALLAAGLAGVERLRRSGRAVEGDALNRCRALAESLGVARKVGVAVCDRLAAPVLMGIVRPLVLLPPSALSGWTTDELEMALLHELAHLKRWDNLVNLLQRVAESVLFFHPAAWWISGWVRLERELCCDRLVVERTGRPCAYAEMLLGLAGPSSGRLVAAMAGSQVTTRIRRILNREENAMRLTMTEAAGLIGAAVAGLALAIGAGADDAQKPDPDAESRKVLRQAAEQARAVEGKGDPGHRDRKNEALIAIAEAQAEVGDRSSALENLRLVADSIAPADVELKFEADPVGPQPVELLYELASSLRKAGDLAAARAAIARVEAAIGPFDPAATGAAIAKVEERMAAKDDREREPGVWREMDAVGPQDLGAFEKLELLTACIEERIALGDLAEARVLIRHGLDVTKLTKGMVSILMAGNLGSYLGRAGDVEGGRSVIAGVLRDIEGLPQQRMRDRARSEMVRMLAHMGDLDATLALAESPGPDGSPRGFEAIFDALAETDWSVGHFDGSGIKMNFGADARTPKDKVAARAALAKVATMVEKSGDAKIKARTFSTIAHLQAKAGDLAAARATADAMPDLKRSDHPGPPDGFYDAIKPATLAILAAEHAKAGDGAGATALFAKSEASTRAIADEGQKLVALIRLAQARSDAGDHAASLGVVAESLPLVMSQPEPRRSRGLAMLVDAQLKAGDAAGASKAADAIRDRPGLEKVRALSRIAHHYDKAGDAAKSQAFSLRALDLLGEQKPIELRKPAPGKGMALTEYGLHHFVDFDAELPPEMASFRREHYRNALMIGAGRRDEAVQLVGALGLGSRGFDLAQRAGILAARGDLPGAMKLIEKVEAPEQRLHALRMIASAIKQRKAE